MNLKELKSQPLDELSQTIIFNDRGEVLDSDDSLLQVKGTSYNVFEDSMFCGMNDVFSKLKQGEELTYDCIHIDLKGRESHYDFIVKNISEAGQRKYAWLIYDFGSQYQRVFELQQERNMADIQSKRLSRSENDLNQEMQVLKRLYDELQQSGESEFILVKADNLLVNLDLNEIIYLEAYGDYIKVHSSKKVYVTHNTMKKVEETLPSHKFVRIHRSFIVSKDKISNIEQSSVLVEGKVLPVGKSHRSSLLEKMNQL